MSSSDESFNIMQVDEETKQIVTSYMNLHQHTLLAGNRLLCIIPELVKHLVVHYYYRTHSIYEWKVDDAVQLNNIKTAVPGFSFNHHFKLHKLDWFLKFYPNGTKQSKQGNVFLLLYLRSTPSVSRMSATCRVWLGELDKGREHYKDFNDKNKYTGWRSGLVKSAEIQSLERLTFSVTVTIFEIYDQSGNNVTNQYIGRGRDSTATICSLRKELQCEKRKVQRLTIQIDEIRHSLRGGHHHHHHQQSSSSDSMTSSLFDSPTEDALLPPTDALPDGGDLLGHYGRGHHGDDVDEEKSVTVPSTECAAPSRAAGRDSVFRRKFRRWLTSTVQLGQYLECFERTECDDVRMIEFFEDRALEKEVGIRRTFHRKLILKKARDRTADTRHFERVLAADPDLKDLTEPLEQNGILSLGDLRDAVHSQHELEALLDDDSHSAPRRERRNRCIAKLWDAVRAHF